MRKISFAREARVALSQVSLLRKCRQSFSEPSSGEFSGYPSATPVAWPGRQYTKLTPGPQAAVRQVGVRQEFFAIDPREEAQPDSTEDFCYRFSARELAGLRQEIFALDQYERD
jgi:hypothetical protein